MRKLRASKPSLRTSVFTTLFACLLTGSVSAQFNPPAGIENTYPVAPAIGLTSHTSAYSLQGVPIPPGGGDLSLAAWDHVNPAQPAGVSWQLTAAGTPNVIISQGVIPYANVRDLEVGYLDAMGDPEVLVAYYLNGTGHMIDVYSMATGVPVLLYTNALSTMANYTRISIDCHLHYAAAVVWEDVAGINAVAINNTFPLTFSGILTMAGTNGETTPDVAFSHNGPLNMQMVYYNPTTGNITESNFDYWVAMTYVAPATVIPTVNDINPVGTCQPCGPGTSGIPIIPVCPYPNIDCPGHYPVDSWAYTYTTDNQNISVRILDLMGGGVPATTVVNNNSVLPSVSIAAVQNMHPFCIYDRNCPGGTGITVAWYTTAIDPVPGTVAGYVGLRMDESGTILFSAVDYNTVANNPTWASPTPVLSMSKQDDLFNWTHTVFPEFDPTPGAGFRMENKYPAICTNLFKGEDNTASTPKYHCNDEQKRADFLRSRGIKTVDVHPNPYSTSFKLTIPADIADEAASVMLTDVAGNSVAQFNGPAREANEYLNNASKKLANGTYFINVNVGGKVKESIKVVKVQ